MAKAYRIEFGWLDLVTSLHIDRLLLVKLLRRNIIHVRINPITRKANHRANQRHLLIGWRNQKNDEQLLFEDNVDLFCFTSSTAFNARALSLLRWCVFFGLDMAISVRSSSVFFLQFIVSLATHSSSQITPIQPLYFQCRLCWFYIHAVCSINSIVDTTIVIIIWCTLIVTCFQQFFPSILVVIYIFFKYKYWKWWQIWIFYLKLIWPPP